MDPNIEVGPGIQPLRQQYTSSTLSANPPLPQFTNLPPHQQSTSSALQQPTQAQSMQQQQSINPLQKQEEYQSPIAEMPELPISQLIEDRLSDWRLIIKSLIRYFEAIGEDAHREADYMAKAIRMVDPITIGVLKHSATPASIPITGSGDASTTGGGYYESSAVSDAPDPSTITSSSNATPPLPTAAPGKTSQSGISPPSATYQPKTSATSIGVVAPLSTTLNTPSSLNAKSTPMFSIESDVLKTLLFETQITSITIQECINLNQGIQNNAVNILQTLLNDIKIYGNQIKSEASAGIEKDAEHEYEKLLQQQEQLKTNMDLRAQLLSTLSLHSKKRQDLGVEDATLMETLDHMRAPDVDPWLSHMEFQAARGHHHQVLNDLAKLNTRRQESYSAFENNLCQILRNALAYVETARAAFHEKILQQSRQTMQQIQNIDGKKEMSLLRELQPRYFEPATDALMANPSLFPTTAATATTALGALTLGQEKLLHQPLQSEKEIQSKLLNVIYHGRIEMKKTGVLARGWREMHAILTGTGYMHFYPPNFDMASLNAYVESTNLGLMEGGGSGNEMISGSSTYTSGGPFGGGTSTIQPEQPTSLLGRRRSNIRAVPSLSAARLEPEFSICMSDCNLQPHPLVGHPSEELQIDEIKKSTTLFGKGSATHLLRTFNAQQATDWWSHLAPYARLALQIQTPEGPLATTPTPDVIGGGGVSDNLPSVVDKQSPNPSYFGKHMPTQPAAVTALKEE